MKTTNQKEAVASHAGSTVAINTAINALAEHFSIPAQTSIAQTIAQAFGDNTTPPQPGSSGSLLPSPVHNPGLGNLAAHFVDPGSTTQGSASSQADRTAGLAADRAAAMARLLGMDLANDTDPSKKAGLNIGPGAPSADALKAALTQAGIILNTSGVISTDDPSKGDGQTAVSGGHLKAPDNLPESSPTGSDLGHNLLAPMLSSKVIDETGNKCEKERDYTDKNGDVHHQTTTTYQDDTTKIIVDVNKTSGVILEEKVDGKTGEKVFEIYNPKTRETTVIDQPAGSDAHTVVYKDGKVVYDSDDHKGGGTKMPDGDNQSTLPSWLANQIHNALYHEAKSEHPGNRDGDTINVRNDGPDTASPNDLTAVHGDKMKTLLGGDTTFENSLQGAHIGGTPQPNYNGQAGAIDPGPDSDVPSQANGPEPKDHHNPTPMMGAVNHESGGQQGNGDGHNANQAFPPIGHLVAAAMEDLVKAYQASHSGDHKTAQSVEGGAAGHDIASVLGSNSGGHDTISVAHLILAAQNPKDFDLGAGTHPPAGGLHEHVDAHAPDGASQGTPHAGLTTEIHTSALNFAGDSVESLFAQHNGAGGPGGHGTQATVQDSMHGISLSELNPNLLSALNGVQTGHALGSEANLFGGQNLGGHDLGGHDLIPAHQPEPAVPHLDGGMLVHSELATWHAELAHQLF